MRREFVLATMLVFVAMPALAASRCNQPYAPQFRDGAGASKQDIMSMRDDAQTFIEASDIYQACLLLKSASQQDAKVKVEANQREKVRVGNAYKTAAAAYKEAQKGNNTAALDDLEVVSR